MFRFTLLKSILFVKLIFNSSRTYNEKYFIKRKFHSRSWNPEAKNCGLHILKLIETFTIKQR